MCGIAGLVAANGAPLPASAPQAVKSMLGAMAYRGPDGEGVWTNGSACLGHRRLSIIDLAGGAQPMLDATGRYAVVFNGEIYNFKELRTELSEEGMRFATSSDTEVLLGAYARWGSGCLQRIEGMFAFALWDSVNRTLFCARDHFGKKPFYYTLQNGFFAFSSQLNSLVLLAGFSASPFAFTPSSCSVMRYLAYEYVPTPDTIYENVFSLEPSHFLVFGKDGIKTERYWDLPMPLARIDARGEDLESELYRLMSSAVAKRLVSDVPLGVFLSGGIDSSIVAGLMATHASSVQAFSIGFTEASYDESYYARIAARAFGANLHERILSAGECADALPGIAAGMDTPMADASCAPTWLLSGLARQRVTVALGGDGADELWAGYEHYIGYKLAVIYNKLPQILRNRLIPKLASCLPSSAGYINPRLAVKTFLRGAAAPDWLRVESMLTAIDPEMQRSLLDPDWLKAAGADFLDQDSLYAPTRRQFEHWQPQNAATPLARAFHVYCRQFLLDDILVKVDRCSMLHSLEVRAPFLDKHVAEFAARLPLSFKLRGFRRKNLLKKAFSRLLPPEILKRNKRGFQIPVADWLRGRLKPLLLDMADPGLLARQGIFSAAGVQKLCQEHFSGSADMRKPLWTFLIFQLWWDANIARAERNCKI